MNACPQARRPVSATGAWPLSTGRRATHNRAVDNSALDTPARVWHTGAIVLVASPRRALDTSAGLSASFGTPPDAEHDRQGGGRVEGPTPPVSPRMARAFAVLLQAAAIPLARRRELAAAYGHLRDGGMRHADAAKAIAAESGVPEPVLKAAVHRGVWDCPTCGARTFARLPTELVALDGTPAAPCCVATRATPRAR